MNAQQAEAALAEELHKLAPDISVSKVAQDADLREEFDIDSMDFLSLVSAPNKRFNIPVRESDYPRLSSLSSAAAYLAEAAS